MGVGVGVGLGMIAGLRIVMATGDADSVLLSDLTWTVMAPFPTAKRSACSSIAPVDRPGKMKVAIDCVGEPSNPTSVAVTGPLLPMIVAEYESCIFPVFCTIKRNVAVPGALALNGVVENDQINAAAGWLRWRVGPAVAVGAIEQGAALLFLSGGPPRQREVLAGNSSCWRGNRFSSVADSGDGLRKPPSGAPMQACQLDPRIAVQP